MAFISWQELVLLEHKQICKLFSSWNCIEDKSNTLRSGLNTASQRGAALRILLLLNDELSLQLFDDLVSLASTAHSDISLVRTVIKAMPRHWVRDNIQKRIDSIISEAGNIEDEEPWRRFAELLDELDDNLLADFLKKAECSPVEAVREVATDFGMRGPNSP